MISVFVCLSVCLSFRSHLINHVSERHVEIFYACYLWPLLRSAPTTVNTLSTSGFVDGVMFSHDGLMDRIIMFRRVRHVASLGRSLMSTIALFSSCCPDTQAHTSDSDRWSGRQMFHWRRRSSLSCLLNCCPQEQLVVCGQWEWSLVMSWKTILVHAMVWTPVYSPDSSSRTHHRGQIQTLSHTVIL